MEYGNAKLSARLELRYVFRIKLVRQAMATDEKREHLIERLNQYRGFVFRWQAYAQRSPDWDHDHCSGCWARFAERPDEWTDTVHTEGWVTLWPTRGSPESEEELVAKFRSVGQRLVPSPKLHGFQLDWICPNCFEIGRSELAFLDDPEHPQWQRAGL
jgi:hypothetical protein